MCGLAGVVNEPGVGVDDVRNMIDAIQYRGVDETGVERVGPAVLGHARLAVVDPENGMQPMSNSDDTVWVTFNGEIYNFIELREELKAKGYQFKSRCDTEVLVHLWREEGEAMLSRLVGMFTFFIWDLKNNCGILARDRQGIKPCFYTKYGSGIAFASEIKALLQLPKLSASVNPSAFHRVFSFNYSPPPETCFEGVYHLEPGTFLRFDGDAEPIQKRYWQWPFVSDFDEGRESLSHEKLESLIDDSIRLQMRFDVDGGLYLSGGVDSSVVGSRLRHQWNRPKIDAVGLNFPDSAWSEYPQSEKIAALLGVNLGEALIRPEMIPDIAEKVSWHAEQPHGDFSFFLFYILARQANQQGKIVMFTGDGPDEMLGGFRHNERYFNDQYTMSFSLSNYFRQICYMDAPMRARVLNAEFNAAGGNPEDYFTQLLDPWRDLEPIEQIAAYECTSLMPGNNLVKGDRMGAAWSTEGRAPLMDHRIAEAFIRMPVNQKFRDGHGKYMLKDYAASVFPRELIFKEKAMPTMPIGEWIRNELKPWAESVLEDVSPLYFNVEGVRAVFKEHCDGRANHTSALRTIIMSQIWLRNYIV